MTNFSSRFTALQDINTEDRSRLSRAFAIFAGMLFLTGLTTIGLITTGLSTAITSTGLLALLLILVVQIGVYIGASAFREYYPYNIVFAIIFAFFEGVLIAPLIQAFLTAGLAYVIGQALAITSVVFIGFAVYPLVTGKDFSYLGTPLFAGLLAVIALTFLEFFVSLGPIAIFIDLATIVVFTLFILYDVSKLLNNDFGAVAGAISLYLDFMVLFIELLELLGEAE